MKRKDIIRVLFSVLFPAVLLCGPVASDVAASGTSKGFTDYVPGTPAPAHVSRENKEYSSDLLRFWEDLTGDFFDDICKAAELNLSQKAVLPGDILSINAGYSRYMRRFPNSQLALIDEIVLKPGLGFDIPVSELISDNLPVSVNIQMNSSVQGKSQVVRPLESDRYCRELKTLVKLHNMKAAWPPTVKRLQSMNIGEIWKLPVEFKITAGAGVSGSASEAVEFSLGASKENTFSPSLTLYRMSRNRMRLRVRIGSVKLRKVSAGVSSMDIPVETLSLWNAENFLARIINRNVARHINNALAARFSFTKGKYSGRKLVLEFICDPENEQQMKLLSRFIKGEFGIIRDFISLKMDLDTVSADQEIVYIDANLQNVGSHHNSELNASLNYSGINHSDGVFSDSVFQLPLIYRRETEKKREHNTYQSADSASRLNVYKDRESVKAKKINLPAGGSIVSHNSEKTSYVVQKEDGSGVSSKPVFLYQQYEGGARTAGYSHESAIDEVNDILKYAGVQGNGVNMENTVSADEILPEYIINADGDAVAASRIYRSVVTEFRMMITEDGIQEIIFSPASAIMKAYFNIIGKAYRHVFQKAGDLFQVDENGRVYYDEMQARRRFRYESCRPLDAMKRLAGKATKLIADIFSVKKAGTAKEQTEKFASLAAGKGKSGLDSHDFLKVVVQLLDPSQISASYRADVNNKKAGKSHYERELFNGSQSDMNAAFDEVKKAEERFDDPSVLTD